MKKLLIIAVLIGMVLGCSQIKPTGCTGITGISRKSEQQIFYDAVAAGDIETVKKQLKAGLNDFCSNENPGYFVSRLEQSKSCNSPSDKATKLGYSEIANLIIAKEEKRILDFIDSNIASLESSYCNFVKTSLKMYAKNESFNGKQKQHIKQKIQDFKKQLDELFNDLESDEKNQEAEAKPILLPDDVLTSDHVMGFVQ